jgi:acyl CoA:acetate/3-ketoacid CoA transferase beta subunit
VFTDLAVVDVTPTGFVVRDILDGLTREQLRERTGAPLTFAPDCRVLSPPPLPDTE